MAHAAPTPGKTLGPITPASRRGDRVIVWNRIGASIGRISHFNRRGGVGRNRRQDPAARLSACREIPQARSYHPRILAATLLNHGLAGALGAWITTLVSPEILRWVLGLSFIAMAGWILIPDKLDEDDAKLVRFGVFGTTLIAFFLAEMGDKTQIATVALAAQYGDFLWVVAGTTLGMMLANVPAVYLGERIAHRMPVRLVHAIAAAIFAILGVAVLLGIGEGYGL